MRIVTSRLFGPILFSFAALGLTCLGAGCAASDKQVVQQASQFQTGIKPAVIPETRVNAYLQQVGNRIIAAARQLDAEHVGPKLHFEDKDRAWMFQDITFQLVNSQTVNAFTTGGHYIYIYNGLFQMCKSEDELAAVMSHEYAHIYCRHVQKGTGRQQALAALTLVASGASQYATKGGSSAYTQYAAAAAQTGGGLLSQGYSRQDEMQADEYGFRFYVRAGWPPDHFADFFKDMIAAGYDKTPAVLSDHPTLAGRVKETEKRVASLNPQRVAQYRQPEIADPQTFAQYKQTAIAAAKGLPNDQQVLQAKNLLQALPRSCWMPDEPEDQKQAEQRIVEAAQRQRQQPEQSSKGS